MLGLWGAHAPTYLLVLVTATPLSFALPICLMPLAWARRFTWRVPEDTHLALYFGRCLGAFALVFEALLLRAALTGDGLLWGCQMLLMVSASMVVVHLWGAVQRVQPWIETLEIGLYGGLFGLTLLFYPVT